MAYIAVERPETCVPEDVAVPMLSTMECLAAMLTGQHA